MNRGTYEALRQVGATEAQAIVLASAIPDIDQPITDLRSEMDRRFTELELKFVRAQRAQTVWLASLIVTVLLAVIASNFF